ncbi:putative aminoacyltransferase, E1 ubiquitin-activating enzyme [Rosa chinensis]|uniref:RING-type E3 ubiquitin transferase n=1 Tax=Rosa chinensis TaxID=74649 RepID=A0A2P6SA12_ROSCH|nr:putative aminoacyltransferase, E1 ubiquitin-activating enzyme [Rosa chinensis]
MGLASHGRNLAFQIGNPKPRLLIRVHYCSYKSESKKQEDDETVREICTILKRSREWESVLSSSGFPKKLNPCVVRSVLQQHHQVGVCPNGHTLCSSCKTRVQNCCPTCRNELGNIRCLALEKVAESLDLPCRYQIYGCPDIFHYYSKLKHEKVCKYRPYNCPYVGAECSVTGVWRYPIPYDAS